MQEAIGWGSSVILLMTILRQIHKQWQAASAEGVSVWLYAGQLAASAGFTVYSVLIQNWVFVCTNAVMAASAIAGWWMVMHFRRKKR